VDQKQKYQGASENGEGQKGLEIVLSYCHIHRLALANGSPNTVIAIIWFLSWSFYEVIMAQP
jgi:hypothetical protein